MSSSRRVTSFFWTTAGLVAAALGGWLLGRRERQASSPNGAEEGDGANHENDNATGNETDKDKDKDSPVPSSRLPEQEVTRRLTLEDQMAAQGGALALQPIGVVHSVYALCVGTPRQGLLAPHARGRIELQLSEAAVDGLAEFSHVWIVFVFHLNTLPAKTSRQSVKIAPPALGGRKIGVLACRSPHRPNPIGMTLAKLDRISTQSRKLPGAKRPSPVTCLHLSGLDLVDGTPVLDIKPYVPVYDTVKECRLPEWVSKGLQTQRPVEFTEGALSELAAIVQEGCSLAFYGHPGESRLTTRTDVQACITEVLSMDVRSRFQTNKARKGNFQAERSHRVAATDPETATTHASKVSHTSDEPGSSSTPAPPASLSCTQQLDRLLISYTVHEAVDRLRVASHGSGAEDQVTVTSIQYLGPPACKKSPVVETKAY
jgi:tRNA-Thr(GGU) m(6)t(6)A37 methyltransferase TsaA